MRVLLRYPAGHKTLPNNPNSRPGETGRMAEDRLWRIIAPLIVLLVSILGFLNIWRREQGRKSHSNPVLSEVKPRQNLDESTPAVNCFAAEWGLVMRRLQLSTDGTVGCVKTVYALSGESSEPVASVC